MCRKNCQHHYYEKIHNGEQNSRRRFIMKEIIIEIKDYMARNKLSQNALSHLLHCDQSTISRWFSGYSSPSLSIYTRFQKLLEEEKKGIKHDWLHQLRRRLLWPQARHLPHRLSLLYLRWRAESIHSNGNNWIARPLHHQRAPLVSYGLRRKHHHGEQTKFFARKFASLWPWERGA